MKNYNIPFGGSARPPNARNEENAQREETEGFTEETVEKVKTDGV